MLCISNVSELRYKHIISIEIPTGHGGQAEAPLDEKARAIEQHVQLGSQEEKKVKTLFGTPAYGTNNMVYNKNMLAFVLAFMLACMLAFILAFTLTYMLHICEHIIHILFHIIKVC